MANDILLDDNGFLVVHYDDHQTPEIMKERLNKLSELIPKMRAQNKPVKLLAIMNSPGDSSHEVRKMGVEAISNYDFDKVAIFGNTTPMRNLFNFLLVVAGRKERVKYFEDMDMAKKWLRE